MNRLQIISRAFGSMNIGALFTGLVLGGNAEVSLNIILLLVLMASLRIKFWLDDEAYFEDVASGKLPGGLPLEVGFTFAVMSWLIWMFAALFIKHFETASLLMAFFFLPSTAWIIATMIKKGAYAEQVPWLFFNVFYVVGFALIFTRNMSWNPFAQSAETFSSIVLVLLLIVFLFDLVVTRILEQQRRVTQKV